MAFANALCKQSAKFGPVSLEPFQPRYDQPMRRLSLLPLFALVGSALFVAPQAFAKGPVMLCGASACAPLLDEGPGLALLFSTTSGKQLPVPPPTPYFVLEFRDVAQQPLAYWIPDAGALQFTGQIASPSTWVEPQPELAGMLAAASSGIVPYRPRAQWVMVGAKQVAKPESYFRLYAVGTPTSDRPNRHTWVRIWISAGLTPWANGLMWISFSGPYLLRDGQLLRIPNRIAFQIRHRLPLTG